MFDYLTPQGLLWSLWAISFALVLVYFVTKLEQE